jgi:predicted nuclease with TOPRIM domain
MTPDGCLSAKRVINRGTLKKLQTELPKYLKEKGFNIERGIENNQTEHMKITELKKKTFDKLSLEYDKNINALKKAIEVSKTNENILNDLKSVETKKSILGGKISLNEDDYNKILNLAKEGLSKSNEILELKQKITNLHYENSSLKESSKYYRNKVNQFQDELDNFKNQVANLSEKVDIRTRAVHALKDTAKKHNCYDEAKTLFNERENKRALALEEKNKMNIMDMYMDR